MEKESSGRDWPHCPRTGENRENLLHRRREECGLGPGQRGRERGREGRLIGGLTPETSSSDSLMARGLGFESPDTAVAAVSESAPDSPSPLVPLGYKTKVHREG